jgi:sigma-E factor negative regulatory protein RseB
MPALRRPGLLVSAAVTITVPGVLAALAVLGHERVAPEAAYSPPVALPADSLPAAPAATVPATGPRQVHVAAVGIEMATDAVGAAVTSASQAVGLRLLGKSATAGLATSYQGVELIAQLGVGGAVTMISDVWHRSGGETITRTTDAKELGGSQPYVAYDVDSRSPEGVFGVTKTLVTLLGRHYAAVYRGSGSALGRPALIVDLHRGDGSMAARFWLDRQTMVPLRRDVYDTSAQLISEDAFVQVQFGSLAAQPGAAGNGGARQKSAWARADAPAKLVAGLNGSGWHLPAGLPGGLPLYAAAHSQTGMGQVVWLGYSDGLSVVSLFAQRGTLPAKMAGWTPVDLSGHLVYVAGHSITWAGRGFVYTIIAEAPPQTVKQVVASLPPAASPGFLGRIGRGLDRLAALVNPFG